MILKIQTKICSGLRETEEAVNATEAPGQLAKVAEARAAKTVERRANCMG